MISESTSVVVEKAKVISSHKMLISKPRVSPCIPNDTLDLTLLWHGAKSHPVSPCNPKINFTRTNSWHLGVERLEKDKYAMIREAHLTSYLLDTQGLSVNNVKTIMRNISSIQRVWGITEPSFESALLLKKAMREKGRSTNSIRQYMWALKYWAKAYGSDIDFKKVPLPKAEKKEPRILDFDMVRNIIDDEGLPIRNRAIMVIFAITACRNGELASIKLADIDHKERTILLHDTKTHKEKTAPIPPRYYTLISSYIDQRAKYLAGIGGKTDALIISERTWKDRDGTLHNDLTGDGIRQVIYRISERYGIDGPSIPGERRRRALHPHTMRHTATTKLLETLGNPEEVMRITGHSSSAMLDWYSHPRLERIKNKMKDFKY